MFVNSDLALELCTSLDVTYLSEDIRLPHFSQKYCSGAIKSFTAGLYQMALLGHCLMAVLFLYFLHLLQTCLDTFPLEQIFKSNFS